MLTDETIEAAIKGHPVARIHLKKQDVPWHVVALRMCAVDSALLDVLAEQGGVSKEQIVALALRAYANLSR
jgi:hypothetical protein